MMSSGRACAATWLSSNRPAPAAQCRVVPALIIEPSNVGQDRDDLAVAEHRAERRHGAGFALLDAVDDVFVAAFGLRQLWTPALGATAVLVAEAAGVEKHLLAVEIVSRCLGRLRARRRRNRRRRNSRRLGDGGTRQQCPDGGHPCDHHKPYWHSSIR